MKTTLQKLWKFDGPFEAPRQCAHFCNAAQFSSWLKPISTIRKSDHFEDEVGNEQNLKKLMFDNGKQCFLYVIDQSASIQSMSEEGYHISAWPIMRCTFSEEVWMLVVKVFFWIRTTTFGSHAIRAFQQIQLKQLKFSNFRSWNLYLTRISYLVHKEGDHWCQLDGNQFPWWCSCPESFFQLEEQIPSSVWVPGSPPKRIYYSKNTSCFMGQCSLFLSLQKNAISFKIVWAS